jgi:3-phosphoshikimate 1-carboxyvinyltransferase
VQAIASKSEAHRALICAALADECGVLGLSASSADIEATIRCLVSLGAQIAREGDLLTVRPIRSVPPSAHLPCKESGSTLRFLLPVAAALGAAAEFTGTGRLPQRPILELISCLEKHGAVFSGKTLPFTVTGSLTGGIYELPGDISSQFVSGLLFALPLLAADSEIRLASPLQSSGYVDMTLCMLRRFSVSAERTARGFRVPGGQRYTFPGRLDVEGDWSNAAFFLAMGALGRPVSCAGLRMNSLQKDRCITQLLRRFGADVEISNDTVTVSPGPLRGMEVDLGEIPDLLPVLAVVAAAAKGETGFRNAARLRLKESDRLFSVAALLRGIGAEAEETEDGILVRGRKKLPGGRVESFGDHRIAMAAAVAATVCEGNIILENPMAVENRIPASMKITADWEGAAMSSEFGEKIKISIFGESHGPAIGVLIDGLPPGEEIDPEELSAFLARRAPGSAPYATARKEADRPRFLSGLSGGKTCGTPLCVVIENCDVRSEDYDAFRTAPRPGHADFTALARYGGYADMRGGGHFSGRLTAPLCVAGSICLQILKRRGVTVGAHIFSLGSVEDRPFDPVGVSPEELRAVTRREFPVLDPSSGERMKEEIQAAAAQGDSLGGIIECCALGLPAGIGEPMFGGVENRIAQAVFGIPAVRGLRSARAFPRRVCAAPNTTIPLSSGTGGSRQRPITTGACSAESRRECRCCFARRSSPLLPSALRSARAP